MSSHSEIPSASDVQAVQEEVAAAEVKNVVPAAKPRLPPASWSCPAVGMADWCILVWKGKQYLRNINNEVWLKGEDGGFGEWQGIFKPMEGRIDDSVPEPVFDY
jgi:hypothetical protein